MIPEIPPKLAERFRRVCPEWARHILDGRFDPDIYNVSFVGNDRKRWSIKRAFCCIVGEAHKRQAYSGVVQPYYGCQDCEDFAVELTDMRKQNWPDMLRWFLDHYEKEHAMGVTA